MDSNSDDSTEAKGNSDDTVWPPPPTGPRVVTVRLPAQSLFFLSVPEMLNGFSLPPWAKSAGHYLLAAFAVTWIYTEAATLAKVLLGCLVLGIGTLLLDFFLGAGIIVYAHAASAVTGKVHTPANRDGKDFMPNAWLKMSSRLMFFAWGLSVLFSNHRHLITWTALVFWLALIAAGLGVAVVNGVKHWLLSRRRSGHPGR